MFAAGGEPDPRFSLANERTFLAWIRTSLGLLATGVALEALGLPVDHGYRRAASVLLVLLAVCSPLQAYWGWGRTERALRRGRPLPAAPLAPVIAAGAALAGVLVLIGLGAS